METTSRCPKCGFSGTDRFSECPKCGIVVSKFIQREKRESEKQSHIEQLNQSYELAGLKDSRKLFVRQQIERVEVWFGLETRNRYTINSGLFDAAEMSTSVGAILSRLFLANWRPFRMEILNRNGRTALELERPFRFFFHKLEIFHANGEILGTVVRRFGIVRRHYIIRDAFEREVFTLFGPVFHPWTFRILQNGREIGKITKKWSGFFKETFSKADDFGVEFPPHADIAQKALLMGAVFLIDFVHFETPNK